MPIPRPSSVHDRVLEIAASQHGLVTPRQAYDAGLTRGALAHQRHGDFIRMAPGVLVRTGTPATPEQAMLAAQLDAGAAAVLALATAAAHWGYPGFELLPPQVCSPRPRRHRQVQLGVHHTSTRLPDTDVTQDGPFRFTTPARTLFDLAGSLPLGRLERLVDRAWAERLVSGRQLRQLLAMRATQGRAGIVAMRQLLRERGDDYRPPDSGLERRAIEVLQQAGIRDFDRQAETGDDDAWIARVDLRHRRHPVVVQIDSDRYHRSIADQRKDEAETRALIEAGFIVVRSPSTTSGTSRPR
ncbi:MAG: type IV toxin-antitoxin system AbiEi family antitoxin domain-containing protein [Acidimicrobiales bacterium]